MFRPAAEAYSRHVQLIVSGIKRDAELTISQVDRRLGVALATYIFLIEVRREDVEVQREKAVRALAA